MSPIAVVLLVAAAVLVLAAEWPRISARGPVSRTTAPRARRRRRGKSKANLQVVRPDSEDFARSVERDLAALPTIDEHDARHR